MAETLSGRVQFSTLCFVHFKSYPYCNSLRMYLTFGGDGKGAVTAYKLMVNQLGGFQTPR